MRRWASLILAAAFAASASGAEVSNLLKQICAVGAEGSGNADAAAAWSELSRQDRSAIMPIIIALDDASPRAANWLRSALDAIVERERKAGRPLPTAELEKFLADAKHKGPPRRLCFELLTDGKPDLVKQLIPAYLNDPSLEMRFAAVAQGFEQAKALPKESAEAKETLLKLVQASRDADQVEEIGKELENRGAPVDFLKLYGFITQWNLCAAYDNTAGKGFHTAYPPESKVELNTVAKGKNDKDVKWQGHVTTDKMGMVDLNKVFGKEKNAVAYAFTVIDSPEDRPVEIRAASATALKIYVNGQEVLGREVYHQSFTVDSHIAPAQLKKGRNTILIKICQNDQKEPWAQDWRFQVRVSDALGTPVAVKVEPVAAKEGSGS